MKKIIYVLLAGFALIILLDSIFIVEQREQALVFQFGEVVRVIKEPGLKFRLPILESVVFYDNRILNLSAEDKEFTAKDQKRLIVNAYAKFKIKDPLQFYKSVKDESGIRGKLNSVIDSSMRQIIGEVPLQAFLTNQRVEIMSRIKQVVNDRAKSFGVDVIDVRISRADLPKENSEAIYQRMKTDREKEAKEIRAKGAEQAEIIRAEADKQRTIILAEANRKAQILSGEGDATAMQIYAKAFTQDSEFYSFYRNLEAYRKTLDKETTKMILSPDSEFLRVLKNGH